VDTGEKLSVSYRAPGVCTLRSMGTGKEISSSRSNLDPAAGDLDFVIRKSLYLGKIDLLTQLLRSYFREARPSGTAPEEELSVGVGSQLTELAPAGTLWWSPFEIPLRSQVAFRGTQG
jgi:hypothetical protein